MLGFGAISEDALSAIPSAGSTTQNVTFSKATLTLAGFALPANAKAQMPVTMVALKLAGFSLGTNAKTMLQVTGATISFAGFALLVGGAVNPPVSSTWTKGAEPTSSWAKTEPALPDWEKLF